MFARTQRLFLRPIWPEDAEQLFNAIADEQIVRNITLAQWQFHMQNAERFAVTENNLRHPNFLLWRRTKGEPELVGSCGVADREGIPELGFWIIRKYWGLGYATEAARVVTHIARTLGHSRLVATHCFDNPASAKVLRNSGFRHNGQMVKRMCQARGEAVPSLVYEIRFDVTHAAENCAGGSSNMDMPSVMRENLPRIAA